MLCIKYLMTKLGTNLLTDVVFYQDFESMENDAVPAEVDETQNVVNHAVHQEAHGLAR